MGVEEGVWCVGGSVQCEAHNTLITIRRALGSPGSQGEKWHAYADT